MQKTKKYDEDFHWQQMPPIQAKKFSRIVLKIR